MTALVRMCRQLAGRELIPRLVELAHRRNVDTTEVAAFSGSDIEFGAMADRVTFDASFRDIPVVSADHYLTELLIGYGEQALARWSADRGSFRTQVVNATVPLLPHGKVRAAEIARSLGVSQRSLARRLAAEGTPFSEVLEGLRSDLAQQYLADQSLTISHVAWLLGYHEVSAFTHAFKRWTGTTPRKARAAQDGAAS